MVCNAVLSRFLLKEHLPRKSLAGVFVTLAGAVLVAISAPTSEVKEHSDTPAEEAVYDSIVSWRALAFILVIMVLLFALINPFHLSWLMPVKTAKSHVVVYCMICAILGSFTVISSKGVSTAVNLIFAGNYAMFSRPDICWLTYLLVASAAAAIVGQMRYLNEGLKHFGSSKVITTFELSNIHHFILLDFVISIRYFIPYFHSVIPLHSIITLHESVNASPVSLFVFVK